MSNIGRITRPIFFAGVFLSFPLFVFADSVGQQVVFSVDSNFDAQERSQIPATLRKVTNQLYFYIENGQWNSWSTQRRNDILVALEELGSRFESEIYPSLTNTFGTERRPGIDRDERITVLLHNMRENVKGYFSTADGYTKFEAPSSNEREMVYLNLQEVESSLAKSYLAHEFLHLVYFNQKEVLRGVSDDIWIQEGFAELAPTLLGYDRDFEGSYLAKRVRDFTVNPRDSLTEWRGLPADYGVVNMFFQYVRDRYGVGVLVDVLKSRKAGIAAVSEALAQNDFKEDFFGVFTDWTVAVFLNDCLYGERYCFSDENLQKVRIPPFTNFLSPFGESELTVTNSIKNWAGNWHKISGGKGILEVKFDGNPNVHFVVPYLVQKKSGEYEIDFFRLGVDQTGRIQVKDFGSENVAVVIVPSIQDQTSGFGSLDPAYLFSWTVSTVSGDGSNAQANPPTLPAAQGLLPTPSSDARLIAQMTEQITLLQAEVARLQAQLATVLGGQPRVSSCQTFPVNLSYGMPNNEQVQCLQQFLKNQGSAIYPEGLVTGNFLSLTQAAVIRFQEAYAAEILAPFELQEGTGFVGPLTRKKMNELIGLQ